MKIDAVSINISNQAMYPIRRAGRKRGLSRIDMLPDDISIDYLDSIYEDAVEISEDWTLNKDVITNQEIRVKPNSVEETLLLSEPKSLNLSLISARHLSNVLDRELIILAEKLNAVLRQQIEEKLQDDFRALEQASDALDSYNDHEIAILGPIYKASSVEVMDPFVWQSFFDVGNLLASFSVFNKKQWQYVPKRKDEVQYLLHSNIFDLILYYLLLTEQFPIGRLSFYIEPNFKREKKHIFEVSVSIKEGKKVLEKYTLTYDAKTKIAELYCHSKKTTEEINFNFLYGGKLSQYYGSINKHLLVLKIFQKDDQVFERIIVGNWMLDKEIINEDDGGKWYRKKGKKTKSFEVQAQNVSKNKCFYLVSKFIQIGEDNIHETVLFRKGIPIPIAGGGVIINREEYKSH